MLPETVAELKRAVANNPRNAELRHLLGAEMAQHGFYDDAVVELTTAVAIDPSLHTARFQLGLLYLTMAQPDLSAQVLAPLEALENGNPFKQLQRGLVALMQDDYDACIASLQRGIALNRTNPALNRDIELIIARLNETRAPGASDVAPAPLQPAGSPPAAARDFSLYRDVDET